MKKGSIHSTLSEILRNLREGSGFSQQEMADNLKIHRTTYTCYETGKTEPSLETIQKIAQIFGVDITVFFNNEAQNALCDLGEPQLPRFLYELTKNERRLIGHYRLLSPEEKSKLEENLKK